MSLITTEQKANLEKNMLFYNYRKKNRISFL